VRGNLYFLASLALVLCGMILSLALLEKKRIRQLWAKSSLVIAGLGCIFVGSTKIALHYHWIRLITEHSILTERVIVCCAMGFVLGLIFALIVSGELFGKKLPTPVNPSGS
jgi:hypothetical protein